MLVSTIDSDSEKPILPTVDQIQAQIDQSSSSSRIQRLKKSSETPSANPSFPTLEQNRTQAIPNFNIPIPQTTSFGALMDPSIPTLEQKLSQAIAKFGISTLQQNSFDATSLTPSPISEQNLTLAVHSLGNSTLHRSVSSTSSLESLAPMQSLDPLLEKSHAKATQSWDSATLRRFSTLPYATMQNPSPKTKIKSQFYGLFWDGI